jgi:hypothetical protein
VYFNAKQMKKPLLTIWLLSILFSSNLKAQHQKDSVEYTPYELMSSFYNEDFKPFKKKNGYIGLAFNLEDRIQTNTTNILQTVISGERLNYEIDLKGGYYTGDYGMAGLNISYYQRKFDGKVYQDPDTIQSNTISRGYSFTPNFRSSVPLTKNERLSFFTRFGVTFGFGNSLSRSVKNLDEVDKTYSSDFNFRVGISPGITFFAIENFAFEVQLNVLGYELQVSDKSVNEGEPSREIRQNVDFNIDIFSLQLGLAYNFGSRK